MFTKKDMFTKKELEYLKADMKLYFEEYNATLPTDEELADVEIPAEVDAKARKLIAEFDSKPRRKIFTPAIKRAAVIVAAVLIAATTMTFSVKGLRESFLKFIIETFEKFTSIVCVDDSNENNKALEKKEPTYIPEGYTIERRIENSNTFHICYINKDTAIDITYIQSFDNNSTMQADTEDTECRRITINNYEGVFYINKNKNYIVFGDGEYLYSLYSTIEEKELIKMAESIVEK